MKIETDRSVESIDDRDKTVEAPRDEGDEDVTASAKSGPGATQTVSARTETIRTVRTTRFTPSAVVAAVVAIAMLVLGGITVGRAGFDGSLGRPVVTVAGFTATALLGLIVFGFGAVLLIGALARQRHVILVLGIIGGVAGLIAVFEPTVGGDSLSIERELGVWAAITMAVLVASALLPTMSRVNTRQTTDKTDVT